VFVIRGTKKFLDRAGRPIADPPESSNVLGERLRQRPVPAIQVALFVNARTFLPVLMPMAPAASVVPRFPTAFADVVNALGIDPRFVASETEAMREAVLGRPRAARCST
jgi:hypothetical protein